MTGYGVKFYNSLRLLNLMHAWLGGQSRPHCYRREASVPTLYYHLRKAVEISEMLTTYLILSPLSSFHCISESIQQLSAVVAVHSGT